MDIKDQQTKLANNIGKLLRDKFGKGPRSVLVTLADPYLLIYVRGFISAMEQILLEQGQELTVRSTREFLIKSIEPEIKGYIKDITDKEIQHIYYDWNLNAESGIFVGVIPSVPETDFDSTYDYKGKDKINNEIIQISEQAEKTPGSVSSFLVSPRALIVFRQGILVPIEKLLVSLGFDETLRVAKRQLEGELIKNNSRFSEILNVGIEECFLDWDFELDNSVIALILKPDK